MPDLNVKSLILFVLFIVAPTSILAYLSIRSFRDEPRSALADIHLLLPMLQQRFDQVVEDLVDSIDPDTPPTPPTDLRGIALIFTLDADGRFTYPAFRRLVFSERSPAVREAMNQGEELEFVRQDYASAATVYQAALAQAETAAERAELLNALGRIAVKSNDLSRAREIHAKLKAYSSVFDADGAHPFTSSCLRLARRLPPLQRISLLKAWTTAILKGEHLLYPGFRYAIRSAREQAKKSGLKGAGLDSLMVDLDRIEEQVDLVEG